ncbi:hypothetical protein [Candidatus Uabimicrobium sp. HlEnr_7]|uniref:hypothetical protein n=1 Tax=Candidatus Uabimicrobium helgolandensis TaxID=3095367 RepID=UPI003556D155
MKKNFVCGLRNIANKTTYAGTSNKHLPSYEAVTVTNCSGHHNVQMFFMTKDARVVNCLPGFWNPDAFLSEVKLATSLNKLYHSSRVSISKRNELFLDAHLEKAFLSDKKLHKQSKLQGFDVKNIEKRSESDFKRDSVFVDTGLKSSDQVLHERMAERPFLPFEMFDTAQYIDMGRKKYKYNKGVPEHDKKMAKKRKRKRR